MKKIIAMILLSAMVMIVLSGCGSKTPESQGSALNEGQRTDAEQEKTNAQQTSTSIDLNGKKINLPCSISELRKAGVYFADEDGLKALLEKPDSFDQVNVGFNEDEPYDFMVEVDTGSNPEKGEDNASIVMVYFSSECGITVGKDIKYHSTVQSVIDELGEDSLLYAENSDNLNEGIVNINTSVDNLAIVIYGRDGLVEQIDVHVKD